MEATPTSLLKSDAKQINAKAMHMCYEGEIVYYKDPESGRCFTNRDMKVELNPNTLKPLK